MTIHSKIKMEAAAAEARGHGRVGVGGVNSIKRAVILALIAWCVLDKTSSHYDGRRAVVIFVDAFSASPAKSSVHNSASTRRITSSSLGYKDRDEDVIEEGKDEDTIPMRSEADAKNATCIDQTSVADAIQDSLTNVIYYNDLDNDEIDGTEIPLPTTTSAIVSSSNNNNNVLDIDNHNCNNPTHVDPPIVNEKKISQPTYMSPIQLIKKVPKAEPMSLSTFVFGGSLDDGMEKKPDHTSSSSNEGDNSNNDPGSSSSTKYTSNPPKESKIVSWKTKMSRNRPFSASSYLESLNANANATLGEDSMNNDGSDDNDDHNLLRSLRNQQGQIRTSQIQAMQKAMHDAMRRTNPKEAIARRLAKAQEESKKKEREKLERLYLERKKRLDAKIKNEQMYLEERERQKKLLEQRAGQRKEKEVTKKTDAGDIMMSPTGVNEGESSANNAKQGIPILDILSRPPVIDAPPLLVGSTLTYQYSDLTPFQKRAIDVALSLHEENCSRMKRVDGSSSVSLPQAGDKGGIQAAPIIAVIDSYTAMRLLPTQEQRLIKTPTTRYATLASIKILKGGGNGGDGGTPTGIKLTGVGRAFVRDYFSSKHAGSTEDEMELSKLLTSIQELDRDHSHDYNENDIASDHDIEADDMDMDLPVVMAEFDIFLDDSSIRSADQSNRDIVSKHRSSSVHAIAELYRTANKVYRLHEERKKLVAGVHAGLARLRLGKKKIFEDLNCLFEFEDCDNLGGLISGELHEMTTEWEDISTARSHSKDDIPMRSRLEAMENYGFGSYGILSTIPDLTQQSMLQLESYYSPLHRQREEYEAEVASMVIFRTLEKYASPNEMAAALLASSAIQRLELGYEIMMRHRNDLSELVMMMSQDLMDCGEECSDLW